MQNTHSNLILSILSNYKTAQEHFIVYNDIIAKIQNTHSLLLNKNTYNFFNYSLDLDLLYFNKQLVEKEYEYFVSYRRNCLIKLYQDLYLLLKQIIKSLYSFESSEMESEKDYMKKKLRDIVSPNSLDVDVDPDIIISCINLIKDYFENYKIQIENFHNFIEANCTNKKNFDIKNVIVNLNTQHKKFLIEYDGISVLFLEVLESHSSISNKFITKITHAVQILHESNYGELSKI
jgi:hypothetical protein